MNSIRLKALTWGLALLPILVMLAALVVLKWPAHRAAIASWLVAVLVAGTVFGATVQGLAVASAKGLSLSLFVLLIVWSAVFLYNLVDRLGAVQVIADHLASSTEDPLLRALLLAWGFAVLHLNLTVVTQVPVVKALGDGIAFGLDYPATATALGYQVAAERAYARIRLLGHPAPLILLASALSYLAYRRLGRWRPGAGAYALAVTARRSVKSGLAIAFTVMMAVVVNDAGMAWLLARGLQTVSNGIYPVLAPYLGVLGAFITGSNTNSNVMFGPLQFQTAQALGVSAVLIAAAQSIGGSLGAGVSPDRAILGGAVTGLSGKEDQIIRRALPYCLLATLVVGVETWLLIYAGGLAP